MTNPSDLQKYLGNQIKRYRKMANLSQEQLAENIGIATNSLSSIETGNSFMTVYTLEKILTSLNVTPKELFDFPEISYKETDMSEFIDKNLCHIKNDKQKLALLYNFIRLLI